MLSKKNRHSNGPLSGILVIDTSQGIAGPYCGATLASYGARVIKIDPPQGDWCRAIGKSYGSLTALSIVYNRGKESVVLDLKTPRDLQVLYDLVAEADIFLESSRPGVARKIGIDFETLTQKNESLIYLSVSGFGQKGPYAERPCTDGVAQAFAGFVKGNVGLDGQPHKQDLPISDVTTGLYAFQSVSMALFQRLKTGKAQYLDISLVTSTLEIQKARLVEQHVEGETGAKLNVPSGIYQCADAEIAIALATEAHYQKTLVQMEMEDLNEDPRFVGFSARAENAEAIGECFGRTFATQQASFWEEKLGSAGIIVNRINALEDVLQDENVFSGGILRKTEQAGVGEICLPVFPLMDGNEGSAPQKGQDTLAVLAELEAGL